MEVALAEAGGRPRGRPRPYPGHATPLEPLLADKGPVWGTIVAKHDLAEPSPVPRPMLRILFVRPEAANPKTANLLSSVR